ncbi:uncharacterized protein LOC143370501 [Andrena cerasifolii]|uniref:uncharacterized protein LOC143370501 n=1 Tax=Andrena cerasifolii TaxID=2819439 RepID=UPI004038282C
MDEMSGGMRNMKEDLKEVRKENTDLIDLIRDMSNLKEKMEEKETRWTEERAKMEKRIAVLEETEESRRRKERKSIIIIKGLQIKDGVEEETRRFLKDKLRMEVEIDYIQETKTKNNNQLIKVKLADWENKLKIKANKKVLKGERIHIDDDLTPEQRERYRGK